MIFKVPIIEKADSRGSFYRISFDYTPTEESVWKQAI